MSACAKRRLTLETTYLVLLVCVFLAIAAGSAYFVARLLTRR